MFSQQMKKKIQDVCLDTDIANKVSSYHFPSQAHFSSNFYDNLILRLRKHHYT